MKLSRKQVRRKASTIPVLRFEHSNLTSFSGLFLFQQLIARLHLRERLEACFRRWQSSRSYSPATIVLGLILHLLLGFRSLRDSRYYAEDPMVHRVLGLRRLPDVATVSRLLAAADADSVAELQLLNLQLVDDRLRALDLARVTLDFDGAVIPTGRWAEGTAVGYNPGKRGQRAYYPLFCTCAQTGQVLDVLHRPGNVHDSNGAASFLCACVEQVQEALPKAQIEARMDSAFFSQAILSQLDGLGVEFTVSVPFARFPELKAQIENRRRWRRLNASESFFELAWRPKSWNQQYRFIAVRSCLVIRDKEPVQLDLFVPYVYGYDFKVVMTNKTTRVRDVVKFHNGRGAQEGAFAELKSQGQLDYVPTRTLAGNQIFLMSAIMAYNLSRELQMTANPRTRTTTSRRPPLWQFERLETLRRKLLQRAGRFTRPQGRLTLTVGVAPAVQNELLHYAAALETAA
jgi:hypothetical protein